MPSKKELKSLNITTDDQNRFMAEKYHITLFRVNMEDFKIKIPITDILHNKLKIAKPPFEEY